MVALAIVWWGRRIAATDNDKKTAMLLPLDGQQVTLRISRGTSSFFNTDESGVLATHGLAQGFIMLRQGEKERMFPLPVIRGIDGARV